MGKKSKHSKKSKHQADQQAVAAAAKTKLSAKEYEKELYNPQAELCKLQKWVVEKGLRVIVVFEGRDAAGLKNDGMFGFGGFGVVGALYDAVEGSEVFLPNDSGFSSDAF